MAQIVNKNRDLMKKYLLYGALTALCYVVIALCVFLFFKNAIGDDFQIVWVPVTIGLGFTAFFVSLWTKKKRGIYSAGFEGEALTADLIRNLPEYYCGFQNLKVSFDSQESELDMVVIGPSGVFVVEAKNHKGTIYGHTEAHDWTQAKPSGNRNFYSPIKQVGTHVYRLANLLRQNGFRIHVYGLVYFSNPQAVLQLSGPSSNIPVFCAAGGGGQALLGCINGLPTQITNDELTRLVLFLNQL